MLDFCIKQFKQVGSWHPQLLSPMENIVGIITQEYFSLQQSSVSSDEDEAEQIDIAKIMGRS